jgi:ligand-binding SRPBCC domain-containing protein
MPGFLFLQALNLSFITRFTPHKVYFMKIYTINRKQHFPIDINQAWDFFSSPQNLKYITPRYMGFEIINEQNKLPLRTGQMIEYRVRPKFNIPLQWVTEITHVREPFSFIDEQRIGPFRLWHHEHHFREDYRGVEMTDIVTYALPLGYIGRLIHQLFVKKDLERIFDYRAQVLSGYFKSATVHKLAS